VDDSHTMYTTALTATPSRMREKPDLNNNTGSLACVSPPLSLRAASGRKLVGVRIVGLSLWTFGVSGRSDGDDDVAARLWLASGWQRLGPNWPLMRVPRCSAQNI